MERHVNACWHCVDHFCRMAEVIEMLRGMQPLEEAEAAPLRRLLGVEAPKQPGWKRLFGGNSGHGSSAARDGSSGNRRIRREEVEVFRYRTYLRT